MRRGRGLDKARAYGDPLCLADHPGGCGSGRRVPGNESSDRSWLLVPGARSGARHRNEPRLSRTSKRIPKRLIPLLEDGFIDEVVCQLKSGKEATVYIVGVDGDYCCAKVYKDADRRSFQKVAEYREGRKSRNTRNARAASRRSRHGRKIEEDAWKLVEVDMLYRLADAGVRVPEPYGAHEGVLLMELVLDENGDPAPRFSEVDMTRKQALEWHAYMMQQIVRMLCADVIHGDLSEYNVLLSYDGPVIIDLPQAVAATGNNHAFRLLARDVNNMTRTFARRAPELLDTQYARELWDLYETGGLTPNTVLTGVFVRTEARADVDAVLDQIEEARLEAEALAEREDDDWDF